MKKTGQAGAGRSAETLDGSDVTLAERLLAHLPETGAAILVAGLSRDCGEAEVARRLGAALATISGKRTLWVRAGLPLAPASATGEPSPSSARPGLSDVLAAKTGLDRALETGTGDALSRLDFGTPREDTTALLVSEAFRAFIKTASGQFHWVILACPDLLEQRHAASLVARAQVVAGVLKAGVGQAGSVQGLRELCTQLGKPFAGVILS